MNDQLTGMGDVCVCVSVYIDKHWTARINETQMRLKCEGSIRIDEEKGMESNWMAKEGGRPFLIWLHAICCIDISLMLLRCLNNRPSLSDRRRTHTGKSKRTVKEKREANVIPTWRHRQCILKNSNSIPSNIGVHDKPIFGLVCKGGQVKSQVR